MPRSPRFARLLALAAAALLAGPALAAPPLVPEAVTYQGVLLDDMGDPRTGTVDLTLRVYDGVNGGTLLYTQGFTGVSLVDGVFSVVVGPSGASTDTPVDPLTTSLADALAGDVGPTSSSRFLEVTVGSDPPLPRTQLLAGPYALRAARADSAETADTATSADTVTTVGGLPPAVVTQIYENTNLDGTGPPNNDPIEGFADVDGDGVANFVDPDNDGDGRNDGGEILDGTNPNVPTPQIADVSPDPVATGFPTTLQVTGNLFTGATVTLGGQTYTPQNLTDTSFELALPILTAVDRDLVVTSPGGESSAPWVVDFFVPVPTITNVSPDPVPADFPTTLQVTGDTFTGATVTLGGQAYTPQNLTDTSFELALPALTPVDRDLVVTSPGGGASAPWVVDFFVPVPSIDGFEPTRSFPSTPVTVTVLGTTFFPGLTVQFGSESPTPQNLTPTSFDVELTGQSVGTVPVTVTLTNGRKDTANYEFVPFVVHPVTITDEQHVVLSAFGDEVAVSGGTAGYGVNLGGGVDLEAVAFASESDGSQTPGASAVAFDSTGVLVGIRCTETGPDSCDVQVYRDADADLQLEAGEELATVETLTSSAGPRIWAPSLRFDAAGNVVASYHVRAPGTRVMLARDLDGDDDFDGAGEVLHLGFGQPGSRASDLALDASGRVALAHRIQIGNTNLRLRHDLNGDDDFDDTVGGVPETQDIQTDAFSCVGAAFDGSDRLAVLSGDELRWDRNDDGDFDDAGELQTLPGGDGTVCDLETDPNGALAVVWGDGSSLLYAVDANDDGSFAAGETETVAPLGVTESARLVYDGSDRPRIATDTGEVYFVD